MEDLSFRETQQVRVSARVRVVPLTEEKIVPTPYSVLFGRGKKCTESCGNRRMRVIAGTCVERYANATTREQKSEIVSLIHDMILSACPNNQQAAFIRYRDGRWVQVGNQEAREKISQTLRDCLSEKYRSSSRSKIAARKERRLSRTKKSRTDTQVASVDGTSISEVARTSSNASDASSKEGTTGETFEVFPYADSELVSLILDIAHENAVTADGTSSTAATDMLEDSYGEKPNEVTQL